MLPEQECPHCGCDRNSGPMFGKMVVWCPNDDCSEHELIETTILTPVGECTLSH